MLLNSRKGVYCSIRCLHTALLPIQTEDASFTCSALMKIFVLVETFASECAALLALWEMNKKTIVKSVK